MERITLNQLLREAEIASDLGAVGESAITGLDYDSRRVQEGSLFFAFAGEKTDGVLYAGEAVARGAAAVVSESPVPEGFGALWIQVPHGRQAMALMARRLHSRAAKEIVLTGATGTNGKTTTCTLLDTLLRQAGHTTALLGTIRYLVAGAELPAVNTTPESVDLYRLFDELLAAGGTHATMEVSSHALALGRVYAMQFHTAIFTNLTRDHLDFHKGGMEDYFAAKCELFTGQAAPAPTFAVLNRDDPYALRIPAGGATNTVWYGLGEGSTLRAVNVDAGLHGLRFDIQWEGRTYQTQSPMAGRINVYNILAAFGAGLTLGLTASNMAEGVRQSDPVPGRFERIDCGQPFLVVVDYAHTDDALRNTIAVARGLTQGKVITLFGCGGDRDRSKRPLMGLAAGELSDYVVLTSDNPRSEDPLDIMNDALVGLNRTAVKFQMEPDRAAAIRIALRQAQPGDVVLIAGKGHETKQVLRGRTIHFDDREESRTALREMSFGGESAP